MRFLPLFLTSLMFYGVNADINDFSARVMVDLNAGTITPNTLNVRNGTMITFTSTGSTQDLEIAQSSSLATPCIQVSPDKQYFLLAGEGYMSQSCAAKATRTDIMILYDLVAEPLLFYTVGGCQRGMVLSINVPANDASTFVANAKSSPKEVTTDLSYLKTPPGGCSSPPVATNRVVMSNGAIAGTVVGTVAGFVAIVAIFLIVRRKRRQRKTLEAAQNMSFSTEVDRRQKV